MTVGLKVGHALSAVHAAGIVHRDVKARNVMREDRGPIVLMVFGTGRNRAKKKGAGDLAGTPLYMAPEVLAGSAATQQSDIYSVGVLLYYLVTGQYPVEGQRSTRSSRPMCADAGSRSPNGGRICATISFG